MQIKYFFQEHFEVIRTRNPLGYKFKVLPKTVIGWVLTIFLILLIIFSSRLIFGTDTKWQGRTARNYSNRNISNQWSCRFSYLNGGIQGRFTAKSDSAHLIHSSNLENGTIVFYLYNNKNTLLATFPANNTTDTIKGIFHKGERYKVNASVTKAKGRFDFKME